MSTTTNALAPLNGATSASDTSLIEDLIARGDLAKLSPEQRARFYVSVCESIGLNPLTQPFAYITLNGKLVLYATKGATDQLRSLRGITVRIVSRERLEDVYVVTAEASTPDGRTDSDIGAVSIAGLKGEALANGIMKAVTKAKRRVTLSLVGLGMLDESEVASVPSAQVVHVDHTSGEILDAPPSPPSFARLFVLASKLSLTNADVHALAFFRYGVRSLKDLTPPQRTAFADSLTTVSLTDATIDELQVELDMAHEVLNPAPESVDQETEPDAEMRGLINFRERYEMATTKAEFGELFAEAGDREPYWLGMIASTTGLKRLERLAEMAAEQSAWTGPVSVAYAARHAALTARD